LEFEIQNKKNKKDCKAKFRVFKKASSSPAGFEKNLHPYHSISTLLLN